MAKIADGDMARRLCHDHPAAVVAGRVVTMFPAATRSA
jgi:hypothetical protein